jgi:hypothetical protein
MSTPIPPLLPSPPPPPPPSPLLTVVPHERESWIRSVKKTKINESTEQKTQYLETMLRMPQQQQKSLLNSSRFDRMRFADDQLPTTTTATSSNNDNNNLDSSSFHLVGDINNHDDIRTLEKILFDNQFKQKTPDEALPTPPSSVCRFIFDLIVSTTVFITKMVLYVRNFFGVSPALRNDRDKFQIIYSYVNR